MEKIGISKQLSLNIYLKDDATFDSFYSGNGNTMLVELLQGKSTGNNAIKKDAEQFIFIHGESGVGCTHLLHALCHFEKSKHNRVMYLSMKNIVSCSQHIFEGLENLQVVCIDDIDAIFGKDKWERALFNLFNRLRDSGTRLIIAGHQAPAQLNLQLRDLVSRLSWGLIFRVKSLNDDEKICALQMRAIKRGLILDIGVAQYILHRSGRNMEELLSVLEKLDKASRVYKRKLTVPFIKSIMYW